uniref:Uncharacterized protein n=1 Tax=Tetraodon nigroviridis TaxID=99883 RepID=H3BYX6_TETNG
KHKAQLHSVQQQLESLQQVHQKDFQKALKEQSELSKQEARKAKAAYESELQTWKDKLENYRQQNDVLQRNLRRALETGGRGQSSLQVPLDLQPSQKDEKRRSGGGPPTAGNGFWVHRGLLVQLGPGPDLTGPHGVWNLKL